MTYIQKILDLNLPILPGIRGATCAVMLTKKRVITLRTTEKESDFALQNQKSPRSHFMDKNANISPRKKIAR